MSCWGASQFFAKRRSKKAEGLVIGEGRRFGVREELGPAAVAPEGFQAHQSLIARQRPELPGAFEPALVLPTGRLDGAGSQWLASLDNLGLGGGAFLDRLAGSQDGAIADPVLVVLEISDLGLKLLLELALHLVCDLLQALDHGRWLVLV